MQWLMLSGTVVVAIVSIVIAIGVGFRVLESWLRLGLSAGAVYIVARCWGRK